MKRYLKCSLLTFLFIISATVVTGCFSYYKYSDSKNYISGGATIENVSFLDIDWISGGVEIMYHDENNVTFSESSNTTLDDSTSLHYYHKDDKLIIKFSASGVKNTNIAKTLTVYLPNDFILDEIEVETVSAMVKLENIKTKNIDIETVSGAINLKDVECDILLESESVSGKITANIISALNELSVKTVSGNIDIKVWSLNEFDIESTSGLIKLASDTVLGNGEIETVSGNISLYLNKLNEFNVKFRTTSGRIKSEFNLTEQSKNRYSVGNSDVLYDIETVSGDFNIYFNQLS